MPNNMSLGMSPAATDLGLGDMLGQQVKDETEEQRKKRLLDQQQRSLMGPAANMLGLGGSGNVSGSAALGFGGGILGSR